MEELKAMLYKSINEKNNLTDDEVVMLSQALDVYVVEEQKKENGIN